MADSFYDAFKNDPHMVDLSYNVPEAMPIGPDSQSQAQETINNYTQAVYGYSNTNDYADLNVDVGSERDLINSILEGTGADVSLSQYLQDNPGMDPEDVLRYMSQHSDEYAEKYIDYLLEKKSLEENNRYSAEREDTAYQRLVQDLKKAGLNPALMYGSSASPSASNSLGYLKQSEGATSRTIGNFSKLKNLLLGILSYELYRKLDTTNQITKSGKAVTGMLHDLAQVFSILGS